MNDNMEIEVVYALPDRQDLIRRSMPAGTTVAEGIRLSGVLEKHPGIDLAVNKLGIYGKLTKADAVLRDRDRIEIYRPLIADPKEVRRKRAEEGKVLKKGSPHLGSSLRSPLPLAGEEANVPSPSQGEG